MQREYANRWLYSYSISDAWNFDTLPLAPNVVPGAYRELGSPPNFGSIVELDDDERAMIMSEPVTWVALQRQLAALRADARTRFTSAPEPLKQEIFRMAVRIEARVHASNTTSLRHNPEREVNPRSITQQMLFDKWEAHHGRCGLCQRPIPMPAQPGLLQPSPDRIDSKNPSYTAENVHITRLGCKVAKNEWTRDDFEDWLTTVTAPILTPASHSEAQTA